MRTCLFLVTGTQPDGVPSLKLQDWYRTITPLAAARLANNFWKLHGVTLTRFQVRAAREPETVGRVTAGDIVVYQATDLE